MTQHTGHTSRTGAPLVPPEVAAALAPRSFTVTYTKVRNLQVDRQTEFFRLLAREPAAAWVSEAMSCDLAARLAHAFYGVRDAFLRAGGCDGSITKAQYDAMKARGCAVLEEDGEARVFITPTGMTTHQFRKRFNGKQAESATATAVSGFLLAELPAAA